MKQHIIILLSFAWSVCSTHLTAGENRCSPTSDMQLKKLHERISKTIDTANGHDLICELQKTAAKQGSAIYEGLSYYYFLRHNRYNLKTNEAVVWAERLDTLARAHKFHFLLFEGRKLMVELYVINGDYGQALNEAKAMNEEAGKLNNEICLIIAKNSLATVYIAAGQYKEAIKLLLTAKDKITNNDNFTSCYHTLLLLLIRANLELNDLEQCSAYQKQLQQDLELKKSDKETLILISQNPYSIKFRLYHSYASYYLKKKKPEQAVKYLEKMQGLTNSGLSVSHQVLLCRSYADYFIAIHQYEHALKNLDKALDLLGHCSGHYLTSLMEKAELLSQIGRYQEAYDTFQNLILLEDTVEQNRYIHQINLFKMKYEAEQNEINNEQLYLKSESIYLLCLFLVLFCILLIVLILINHRMKKKLQKVKDNSDRSDHLKSAFLANMNHEIRTPLNAIAGFSNLLADEDDIETRRQYGNIIKENNELLINLLNDVMDISKIESDTMTFSYSAVNLSSLINDLYKTTSLQMSGSVKLIKGTTPEITIRTDRMRLVQILNNLLSNAAKYTSDGEICFGYELIVPDQVRFYVTDTGEGIAEELQKALFVRFVQAAETHAKGVGLGLALCKGFVNQLGGEIGVESKKGVGSTFWFTLPYNEVQV